MTAREAQALDKVEKWLRLSLSEREIRRQRVRDRGRLSLDHRGVWRIKDTKPDPPDLSHVARTVEYFGAWGYRVADR